MFELQTERLRLIPLNSENLKLYLEDPKKLEKKLGLKITNVALEGHIKEAVKEMFESVIKDEENYLWYTNWQIVLKKENRIIGGFCFKDYPNENGEVEIGYGIQPAYQGKGYMTEALREMVKWAFKQPRILAVIAETDKANIPSHKVLEKVGMVKCRETEQNFWWKLSRHQVNL